MTLRTLVASALVLLLGTTSAVAQQQTGEIFGRATDTSGAVLPGATVTVAGPALIQPRVSVTSEAGTYRVPELPIGAYSVTFEGSFRRAIGDVCPAERGETNNVLAKRSHRFSF